MPWACQDNWNFKISSQASSQAEGEPGKQNIYFPFLVPAVALLCIVEVPIFLYEIAHGSKENSQEIILIYIYIFVLFRFFDIKKPFPVNIFDKKFKNSVGVILDDVMAGLYVVFTLIVFMVIKSKFF